MDSQAAAIKSAVLLHQVGSGKVCILHINSKFDYNSKNRFNKILVDQILKQFHKINKIRQVLHARTMIIVGNM